MINLFHGDCMEALARMPDKAYDLAIVDPPYGIDICKNKQGMGRRKGDAKAKYKIGNWDKSEPPAEYFTELFRVSKNQIIWGANHFIEKINKNSSCWIFWDKEQINEEMSFASGELAWTSFTSVLKKFKLSSNQQDRIHPTQKPVSLYKWLLKNYAKRGDRILDTHLGSGSIAIACHDMDFALDAWELDQEYYEKAKKRYLQHAAQYKLF